MTMTQREPLEELRAGCAEKKRLQTELGDLYRQRDELAARKAELERIKREEQEDVERLEGGSLAAFFYRVIGRQEEKMDQEQREAYAAAVKYDAAVRELAYVEQEIGRREGKLGALGDVEQRYARALEEKREALKRENGPVAEEILQLEDRNAWLMQQEREIRAALQGAEQGGRGHGRPERRGGLGGLGPAGRRPDRRHGQTQPPGQRPGRCGEPADSAEKIPHGAV